VDPDAVADFTFVDQTDDVSFFLRFVAVANRLPGVVASKAEVIEGCACATATASSMPAAASATTCSRSRGASAARDTSSASTSARR
jgi:hypothetical protein